MFAFQGRAFGKEQPKYLTIKLDENKQKVYGLEKIKATLSQSSQSVAGSEAGSEDILDAEQRMAVWKELKPQVTQ